MKLIVCCLSLVFLTAGCAIEAGDPTAAEVPGAGDIAAAEPAASSGATHAEARATDKARRGVVKTSGGSPHPGEPDPVPWFGPATVVSDVPAGPAGE
jgi:hypothetical protein